MPVNDAPGSDSTVSFDAAVTSLAMLAEPVRRALYRFVVAQPEPVSRDEAATGTSVAHHIAKFHLDKLVDDGLLDVEFRRPSGRRGPGAGRPSKLYRRSAREVSLSVPERHYELVGRLLARAVTVAGREGIRVPVALREAARGEGWARGKVAHQKAHGKSRSAVREVTMHALADCGYEPRTDSGGVTLINCPFHALAREYTDLVCGLNLDLIDGILSCLPQGRFEAKLDPAPGRCCIRLQNT
jgi:predicted ArsR family transcriptional regulator